MQAQKLINDCNGREGRASVNEWRAGFFVLFYWLRRIEIDSKRDPEFGNAHKHRAVEGEPTLAVHRSETAKEIEPM